MKQVASRAGFLLSLFIDPEDGNDMFLRKACWFSTDYMALYPKRQTSSQEWNFTLFSFLQSPVSPSFKIHFWDTRLEERTVVQCRLPRTSVALSRQRHGFVVQCSGAHAWEKPEPWEVQFITARRSGQSLYSCSMRQVHTDTCRNKARFV
jgi:hypothetical protein